MGCRYFLILCITLMALGCATQGKDQGTVYRTAEDEEVLREARQLTEEMREKDFEDWRDAGINQ